MLQAAAIFKDGMILQRMSKIAVFGDTDCESVEVSWGDKSYIAKIEAGHFTAVIDTDDSRDVKTMIIRGKAGGDKTNEIEIANIFIDEEHNGEQYGTSISEEGQAMTITHRHTDSSTFQVFFFTQITQQNK